MNPKKRGKTPAQATVETPSKTPNRVGARGGSLLTGNPGNKGGGRPPDAFKAMCRNLASSAQVERKVKDILDNGSADPMFLGALKWASEHGYGKPKETVAVEVSLKLTEKMAKARARLADR